MSSKRTERKKSVHPILILCFCAAMALEVTGCGVSADNVTEVSWETIPLSGLILEGGSQEFRDTVQPDNPSGYYDIYDEYEGYRYYVIAGTAENTSSETIRADAFYVEGGTDGKTREGKILFLDAQNRNFSNKIEAGESRSFVMFMLIREDEEPEAFRIFYNEGYETVEKASKYDREVDVAVE